jgi:hypothetical protein
MREILKNGAAPIFSRNAMENGLGRNFMHPQLSLRLEGVGNS